MKVILFRLTLREPVLVAQAGAGEENSAVALPYIPGSALRGALAARWLDGHPSVDLAGDPEGRTWFLDGTLCYLNAYPELDGERALPLPASWFVEKDLVEDDTALIYDLACEAVVPPGVQFKPPKGGPFCLLERREAEEVWEEAGYEAMLIGPERADQVHIMLADSNRRGEGNQVFRYEALAPGQRFIGAITAPGHQDLSEIKRLLAHGDLLLGSAHLAGYGRAAVELMDETPAGWREYPAYASSNGRMVITLLSPAILRGNAGQVGWDGGQALAHSLGMPVGTTPTAVFGRTALAGGYNRKWSLPLPQAWALAAGSVFVFDDTVADPAALQAALDSGIGERRAEGFGRIAVNWQAAALISRQPKPEPDEAASASLSEDSRRQAREMAQRRLRALLDRGLLQRVVADSTGIQIPPTNAQLSAIRQATLLGLTSEPRTMQPLSDYLANLKETGTKQLKRCRLGTDRPTLLEWLRQRADQLDVHAQLLGSGRLPKVAGETAELTDDLKVEYTARLIDGVMQTTARRNREVRR